MAALKNVGYKPLILEEFPFQNRCLPQVSGQAGNPEKNFFWTLEKIKMPEHPLASSVYYALQLWGTEGDKTMNDTLKAGIEDVKTGRPWW